MKWLVLLILGLLAAGCSRADGPPHPPDVHYGQDACAHCSMIVDEPRCASALRTRSGESILFDDLGCMLVWRQAHPESEIAVGWVHDFESGRWIDLATATFVIETRFDTPMASNILAATDSSRATAIAARRGGRPTDLAGATAAALARASHR